MKPAHFIPPALAILGSAYWLLSQNKTITELSEKTRIVKERLVILEKANASATPASILSPTDPEEHDEFTLPDGGLDWEALAQTIREDKGNQMMGMPIGMKTMLLIWKKVTFLEENEVAEGLTKIAGLDLGPEVTELLQDGLIDHYAGLNPAAALEALGNFEKSAKTSSWRRQSIFAKLAKEDPTGAANWLDQQIAEEKLLSNSLGNMNNPRLDLESKLLPNLISSDLAAAKARLAKYPENEQQRILSSVNLRPNKDSASEYTSLVRETLPPAEASTAIVEALGNIDHQDLAQISDSLQKYPITQAEKPQITERLISSFAQNSQSKEKYSEIYRWAETEAPGQSSALVANALSNDHRSWSNPEALVKEAITLSDSLNEPEILNSFVQKVQPLGQPSHFSNSISDPEVRARFNAVAESLNTSQPATSE